MRRDDPVHGKNSQRYMETLGTGSQRHAQARPAMVCRRLKYPTSAGTRDGTRQPSMTLSVYRVMMLQQGCGPTSQFDCFMVIQIMGTGGGAGSCLPARLGKFPRTSGNDLYVEWTSLDITPWTFVADRAILTYGDISHRKI